MQPLKSVSQTNSADNIVMNRGQARDTGILVNQVMGNVHTISAVINRNPFSSLSFAYPFVLLPT